MSGELVAILAAEDGQLQRMRTERGTYLQLAREAALEGRPFTLVLDNPRTDLLLAHIESALQDGCAVVGLRRYGAWTEQGPCAGATDAPGFFPPVVGDDQEQALGTTEEGLPILAHVDDPRGYHLLLTPRAIELPEPGRVS